ncbi:MAG: SH3 domain-containing protein [Candidatus Eisenbacteria bacterium]
MTSKTRKASSVYQSAYPDPLRLRAGDEVKVADKKSEWPGWLWCSDSNGNAGWIPGLYVERSGDTGALLVDYDATELTVEAGDEVEVLKTQNGWAWCRKPDGRYGWLPLNVFEG